MGSSGGSGGSGSGIAALTEWPAPRTPSGGVYMTATGTTTGVLSVTVTIPGDSWDIDLSLSDLASAAAIDAAFDAVIGDNLLDWRDLNGTPDGNLGWTGTGDWEFLDVAIEAVATTIDGTAVLNESVGAYPEVAGTAGVDPWPARGKVYTYEADVWTSDGYTWGILAPTQGESALIGTPGSVYPRTRLQAIQQFKQIALEASHALGLSGASLTLSGSSTLGAVQLEIRNDDGTNVTPHFLGGVADPNDGDGVTAPVGSLYFRDPLGDDSSAELWVKVVGVDNTGWVAITP